jgi:hypothetical protein
VWLPIALAALVSDRLPVRRLAPVVAFSAAIALVILFVAPARILLTERLNKHEVLTTPFRVLARDLGPSIDQAECVIAEDHSLAGNLRLWFPDKVVLDPEVGPLFAPTSSPTVLVWDAGRSPAPPQELLAFSRSFTQRAAHSNSKTFEERLKYHHQRTIKLGTLLIP